MNAAVELTEILQRAQSQDANARTLAEQQLQQLQQQNAAAYLLSLATELASDAKPEDTRQMAGLLMKNALDAIGVVVKNELSARWRELDAGVKQQIHQLLLSCLKTQAHMARHTAALVVAKVAAIELPLGQWAELIPSLLANMNAQPPNEGMKHSTLEALGYVCEELGKIDDEVLEQDQINAILTAVVEGMRGAQENVQVRLAATTALYNALEFAQSNFENDNERNFIMQVVCEGTVAQSSSAIRERSFECLVKAASLYYAKLPSYMGEIFKLSSRAIKEDEEEVAKQAIEFWCTIAEEELDLQDQLQDGEADSSVVLHNFVKAALRENLAQLLLDQLLKQEEDQDKEDTIWNLAMAAGTCLELVATVVADDIIPLVMPFVQANIDKKASPEDWRFREAATFSFGCIMEGPTVMQLVKLVNMGLNFFLIALKDPNSQVRHTTAWTIGRVFEFVVGGEPVGEEVVTDRNISKIVVTLKESLQDEPHIAEKVCYAFSELASALKSEDHPSLLSPYFQEIVAALLQTASRRPDGTTQYDTLRIQTQAFEAINELVRSASADTMEIVGHLIPVILQQLAVVLDPAQQAAQNSPADLQGLYCGVLQVITQRLAEADQNQIIAAHADSVMEALLRVLTSNQATAQEEALLAVGALTYALGHAFINYMPAFYPFLERGLAHYQEWQVCEIAIGVLGDICRALEGDVLQYCDPILSILLTNLQSEEVQRTIKPLILASFSDIALAIGKDFGKYLSHVLSILQSAQGLCAEQQQSGDNGQYLNALRKSIFEAYSGIFQGLPRELVEQQLTGHASSIIAFGEYVYTDANNRDDSVTKALVSLMGDLATQIEGVGVLFKQKNAFVTALIHDSRYSPNPDLAESGTWASNAIHAAMSSAQ